MCTAPQFNGSDPSFVWFWSLIVTVESLFYGITELAAELLLLFPAFLVYRACGEYLLTFKLAKFQLHANDNSAEQHSHM